MRAGHAEWVADAVLFVHDEPARQDVQHTVVGGDDRLRLGGVHGADDVPAGHFAALDADGCLGTQALDVAAGNPDVDGIDDHAGHRLRVVHRFTDGLDRALNIHDHAFPEPA